MNQPQERALNLVKEAMETVGKARRHHHFAQKEYNDAESKLKLVVGTRHQAEADLQLATQNYLEVFGREGGYDAASDTTRED